MTVKIVGFLINELVCAGWFFKITNFDFDVPPNRSPHQYYGDVRVDLKLDVKQVMLLLNI